ncbi:MAG: hypothetical protein HC898_03585 [Phycisphaerales bacterium]|nr:hypothetical protein [Phycisphaerales bacterium]
MHKLRCDEVEEFDPAVWEAAQLVTRSGRCGIWQVRGAVEALSTMHRPHGLMSRLLGTTLNRDAEKMPAQASAWRVFRWSALDVVAPCRLEVACEDCRLWESCGGRARSARGFMAVHDLLTQRARVSDRVWEAEMLCHRPSTSASVYPNFDIARHVGKVEVAGVMPVVWVGGMDFGMRNPTVFLWARVHGEGRQPMDQRLVEIVDEHHQQDLTTGQTLAQLAQRGWPAVKWVGVDPAGAQRNSQSGLSDIQCLQKKGYKVRAMREPLAQGIERIRSRLDHDLLRIDPRCEKLIQALAMYHYDIKRPQCEDPVKDGPDHACDALRYLITNLENHVSKKVVVTRY